MDKKIAKIEKEHECSICRAMKDGRAGTEWELRKAFAEAEKQQKDAGKQK